MRNRVNRVGCILLVLAMLVSLISCGKEQSLQEPVEKIQSDSLTYNPEDAMMDFSVRLFQTSANPIYESINYESQKIAEENVLISPTSVLTALTMTANGAKNDTLTQMEHVFGITSESLNDYMRTYLDTLPKEEKYKLHMANSIWIKEDENFSVNEAFIDTNQKCFNADVFEKAFDKKTLREINDWVDDHTDGMIENILDEIPEEVVMYLINALAFDAEWEEIYENTQIRKGKFQIRNEITQDVDFMYSEENLYLEDEKATGFIKYYADKKYAFAAILPNEDVSIAEYVESMSGSGLKELLENPQEVQVNVSIPKFEVEYDVLLNDILKAMGMVDVFDATKADLSGIGTHTNGNLFVSRVIHKTHMQVDERGTKAGAATVVEVDCESAMESPEAKTVHLNRPFIYMIIDCETNQPIFMGTMHYISPYICSLPMQKCNDL